VFQSRRIVVGIDQAVTNSGITFIDKDCNILYQSTIVNVDPKIIWKKPLNAACLIWQCIEKRSIELSFTIDELMIVRENHSMVQHGNGAKLLELAGALDLIVASKNISFEDQYFRVLPRQWMKMFSVEKPRKVSKSGKTKSVDVRRYILENEGKGKNEHELDSFFMAMYGLKKYNEDS